MATLTVILLTLTLILCGGYAGMILMCQIGILPAMRRLSLSAYADAWRAMDLYMGRLMPPYKASLLLVNAAAVIVVAVQQHHRLAIANGLSLVFSVAGLVLTLRQQIPLNQELKALSADAPDVMLLRIREQTARGFTVRFFLAAAAFIVLCLGVLLWPPR